MKSRRGRAPVPGARQAERWSFGQDEDACATFRMRYDAARMRKHIEGEEQRACSLRRRARREKSERNRSSQPLDGSPIGPERRERPV